MNKHDRMLLTIVLLKYRTLGIMHDVSWVRLHYRRSAPRYELEFTCLSGIIRRFALHNLCDLNPTSWAASVAQLVEEMP